MTTVGFGFFMWKYYGAIPKKFCFPLYSGIFACRWAIFFQAIIWHCKRWNCAGTLTPLQNWFYWTCTIYKEGLCSDVTGSSLKWPNVYMHNTILFFTTHLDVADICSHSKQNGQVLWHHSVSSRLVLHLLLCCQFNCWFYSNMADWKSWTTFCSKYMN